MSRAVHCDLAGCNHWAVEGFAANWITVTEDTLPIGDYCCGAHAWQDLARRFSPLEEVVS